MSVQAQGIGTELLGRLEWRILVQLLAVENGTHFSSRNASWKSRLHVNELLHVTWVKDMWEVKSHRGETTWVSVPLP